MTRRVVVGATFVALLAAAALARSDDRAFDNKALKEAGEGRAIYIVHCARCHGMDARGARMGTNQAGTPDLTLIAMRDGSFDARHVALHIDGRAALSQEMPCWGRHFAGEGRGEGYAATRVYALVKYLDFIQEPQGPTSVKP
jgi:mono/diheme cytochrome c family protein